jgi:hypothetical protein
MNNLKEKIELLETFENEISKIEHRIDLMRDLIKNEKNIKAIEESIPSIKTSVTLLEDTTVKHFTDLINKAKYGIESLEAEIKFLKNVEK